VFVGGVHCSLDDAAQFDRVTSAWNVRPNAQLGFEGYPPNRWPVNRWGFGGYLYQTIGLKDDGSRLKWVLPWWLVVVAFSILPALRASAAAARRRARRRGLCPT